MTIPVTQLEDLITAYRMRDDETFVSLLDSLRPTTVPPGAIAAMLTPNRAEQRELEKESRRRQAKEEAIQTRRRLPNPIEAGRIYHLAKTTASDRATLRAALQYEADKRTLVFRTHYAKRYSIFVYCLYEPGDAPAPQQFNTNRGAWPTIPEWVEAYLDTIP